MDKPIIVWAEDKEDLRLLYKTMLERMLGSVEVIMAEDGLAALDILKDLASAGRKPILIVTDYEMPRCSGLEFLQAVHANPELADVPRMMVSAAVDNEWVSRSLHGLKAEVNLSKPASAGQLFRAVRRLTGLPKIVFIAEDDPNLRAAYVDMLADLVKSKLTIKTAVNGEEAIGKLEEMTGLEKPDLVITDYEMPVKTGLDFLTRIRANQDTEFIPVIMISGYVGDGLKKMVESLNGTFFSKSGNIDQLIGKIKEILGVK